MKNEVEAVGGPATSYAILVFAALTTICAGTIAFGAWCSPVSSRCLPSIPVWTLSGIVFFGIPAAIPNALVVMLLTGGMKKKLHPLACVALALAEGIIGFVAGATFLVGQGP